LQGLAAERHPLRLARPAAVAAVCAALAMVVLVLPGREGAPASPEARAASAAAAATAAPRDPSLESQHLVSEVAQALRAPGRRDGERRSERAGAAEDAAAAGATPQASAAAGQARAAGTDARPAATAARPATGDAAQVEAKPSGDPSSASAAAAMGGSSGREAGTSRDARTNAGVSAMPRGTMPTQRVDFAGARPGAGVASLRGDAQGDAYYDGAEVADRGRAAPAIAAAAATPPTAAPAMALTPAQTRYVQAWTHARATR
jgi:hypothetical protein